MAEDYQHITLSVNEHIARLTLDRPDERNAMTYEMGAEVKRAVAELNSDDSVRVAVVTGAGKAFSAGGNLSSLGRQAGLSEKGPGMSDAASFYRLFLSIRELRVPSIAAIRGHAIGAGLCFAIACDLRVMHEKAKVGMTFVKLGIHPGMAATWNLPRLVGPAKAADLLYTGRLVEGREALELGLVNRVAGDDFDSTVDQLAVAVAGNGPIAVRALKETLRGSATRDIEEAVEREAEAQLMTFTTADAAEGLGAILEKREPRFK